MTTVNNDWPSCRRHEIFIENTASFLKATQARKLPASAPVSDSNQSLCTINISRLTALKTLTVLSSDQSSSLHPPASAVRVAGLLQTELHRRLSPALSANPIFHQLRLFLL